MWEERFQSGPMLGLESGTQSFLMVGHLEVGGWRESALKLIGTDIHGSVKWVALEVLGQTDLETGIDAGGGGFELEICSRADKHGVTVEVRPAG